MLHFFVKSDFFLLLLLLFCCFSCEGQQFVFVMGSSVDARHADGATLQPGGGSFATMNSTVVYKCVDVASDGNSYLYASLSHSHTLSNSFIQLYSQQGILSLLLNFLRW